jgi:hypothetical protein
MRFEFRLFAVAALLLVLIAATCQRQSIAEVRRGVLPWERESASAVSSSPCKRWSGVTLRFFEPHRAQRSIYWVSGRDGRVQAPSWARSGATGYQPCRELNEISARQERNTHR